MIHQRKILKAIAYAILLCFTSLTGAQPLFAAPPNTQLPTGAHEIAGGVTIPQEIVNNTMNITQKEQTSVITWENFSIGADATVNFSRENGGAFNSFNYVNGGQISEIYGQLNAYNGGNIFIANPAGIQIGNSAQINVGSLYVTNKALTEEQLEAIGGKTSAYDGDDSITSYLAGIAPNTNPAAELMSLGSITSATNVTFDGGRIVLDVDRFFTEEDGGGKVQMTPEQLKGTDSEAGSLIIKTNDRDNVVLGYTGYVENEQGEANYSEKGTFDGFKVTITGVDEDGKATETPDTIAHGYMWVEDLDQLQKIAENNNLDGWYALRNSIDANYTASGSYNSGIGGDMGGLGFKPIGTYTQQGQDYVYNYDNAFTGRFDGLGYSLFGLNIKRENENGVGLFGAVHGDNAAVRNLIINGGSITGGDNVGSVAGRVSGGARIEKITNTADVSGNENVGGIAGALESKDGAVTSVTDLVNIGTVIGHENAGGIIGYAEGIDLKGTVYNLGGVAGKDDGQTYSNKIGGLIGEAYNSTIGDGTNLIYNRAGVTGGYDVGGIAGYVHGYRNTITNAANYGDITATGFTETTYSYHTTVDTDTYTLPHNPDIDTDETGGTFATVSGVHAANAGGIAGRADGETDENDKQMSLEFTDVYNYGDVVSNTAEGESYRIAGNVGGIVGSATHTNITNAENSENIVAGAHNVGGIAGYLRGNSKIGSSGNDGGMITATGARNADGYVKEQVSQPNTGENADDEVAVIGNIGGIVGYLYASGQDTKITNSGNRGTVRSDSAANAGGVVGKADTADNNDDLFNQIKNDTSLATISNSYNTGEVQGYTGVGGIAGQMYLGSLAGSYNFGKLSATRQAHEGSLDPLNMGGIVGDTTTMTEGGGTVIYDVYNAGQIGDETFNYYGRHVGGVVGRLSGDIEKAYNIGDIYNGYSTVGGIAGWWVGGNIKNVFNTGNITVVNNDNETAGREKQSSQVGGIVGAYGGNDAELSYAYNLGTIRSFNVQYGAARTENSVGGIVGRIRGNGLDINNVYTTNNIYAATRTNNQQRPYTSNIRSEFVGAIYGVNEGSGSSFANAYFVKLYDGNTFSQVGQDGSIKLNTGGVTKTIEAANNVAYAYNQESYKSDDGSASFTFKDISEADDSSWRIYEGKTLPILNAFTPYAAKNETKWKDSLSTDAVIQYGTAANPLLTIIDVTNTENKNITLNGQHLGLHGAGSLAVYGNSSLTLTDFSVTLGSHYNGTVYSDGALTITTGNAEGALYNLGSGSRLYGSSVTFDAGGNDAAFYGKITATNPTADGEGITITNGKNVTVLGELSTPVQPEGGENFKTTVQGIAQEDKAITFENGQLNSIAPDNKLPTIGQANAVSKTTTNFDGDITIEASGVAKVLFGSMGGGKITTGGDLDVTGEQGIFVDSDFHIGGDMKLTSRVENDDGTVTGGEIVLDLSNMGKTSSSEDESDVAHMHKYFLDHFKTEGNNITVDVANDEDFIIGLDMWDESKGTFDFTKYDVKNQGEDNHTLHEDIEDLNLTIKVNGVEDEQSSYRNHVFTWIESSAHLKAISENYESQEDEDKDIYSYNFALKDDIDASQLSGYTPIASGTNADDSEQAYNGIFDGRGFRIIGLNANLDEDDKELTGGYAHARAGIFGTIGDEGKVRGLSVYDSKFTGKAAAGAIAGVNKGEIKDVITFGNEVKVLGTQEAVKVAAGKNDTATGDISISAAGGVAGVNLGAITGSDRTDASGIGSTHASDTVIAGGSAEGIYSAAGGVAGANEGLIEKVSSTSAVRSANVDATDDKKVDTHGLGGVAGINDGTITDAEAHGATNTLFGLRAGGTAWDANVGGVAGVNYGKLDGVYNESAVAGKTNVGGVVGKNEIRGETQATINNAVNAGPVFSRGGGDDATNAGGIAGANYGSITGGRNTDEVTGNKNVGGVVGLNALGALLQNISNAIAAEIRGNDAVGGIAGTNEADIVIADNLTNEGLIEGTNNVGGVVGVNEKGATIENPDSDVTLVAVGENPMDFGGVAGTNKGTITNATNKGTITAYGAQNVGGIVGVNEESGLLNNAGNKGTVIGGKHVAGVAGVNHSTNPEGRIENSGTVIATAGGAAGIIYGNTADLGGEGKTLELINSGTVVGFSQNEEHGTGGVIGVNSGNIANASLISTVESAVTGGWNTGGLIGYNTGKITGGRALAENGLGYYAYKIYNNGEVTGTQNVGGLIGNNAADGELIAGYNTGRVIGMTADDLIVNKDDITLPEGAELPKDTELKDTKGGKGENAGGIAGTNAGLLDRIFNFVMMNDDKGDKVSGVSNAGGVAGSNSGKLTNAYNATAVEATGDGGNIAGTNAGAIENVYAANADGNLIGSSNSDTVTNAYSFAAGDDSATNVLTGGAQNQAASYEGFDFGGMWKIYEGYGAPLLKVFLTEARYDGETGLVQTGGPLGLPISGVTAGDGLSAYRADNSLLVALKNSGVGDGYLAFASKQIAWSGTGDGFNPNWLGYDIDAVYDITPNPALLLTQNNGHLHWLHRGGDRNRSFRERKAEIYFHEGGMVHE